jgi:DNA-directed RNA polymerase subunit K/omega
MKNVVVIDRLTGVIPNKYEAVRVVAKEARRINALLVHGAQAEAEEKPTMLALSRLLENKIKYKYGEGVPDKQPFEEGKE